MFCEKCGSELNEGAEFCSKCGTAVKEKKSKKDIKFNKDKATEISALDKKECWKKTFIVMLWCWAIPCILFMGEPLGMVFSISLVFAVIISAIYHVNKFVGKKEVICPCCNKVSYLGSHQLSKMEEFTCLKCYNHSAIKENKAYAVTPEYNEDYKVYKKNNTSLYVAICVVILCITISGTMAYNKKLEEEKEKTNVFVEQSEYGTYDINSSGLFVNRNKMSEKTNNYGDLIKYNDKSTLISKEIDIEYNSNGKPTSIKMDNSKATIMYNNDKIAAVLYFSNDSMIAKKVYSYNKNGDVSLVQVFDGTNKIANIYEYEYFEEKHIEYVKEKEYSIPAFTNITLYLGYEIYEKKDVIEKGSVYEILNYCPLEYYIDTAKLKTCSNNPSPTLDYTNGPIYSNIIRKKVEIDYYDADMGYSKRGETTTIYVYDEKDRLVGTYVDDELILKGSLSIYKDSDNVTIRSQFGMYDDVQLQLMNAGENEKYYKRDIKYYYNNGKLTRVEYQEQPTYITFDEYADKKEEYKKYIDKYYEPTNFEFEYVEEKEIEDTATNNNKYEGNTNDTNKDNSYKENTNTDDTNKDNSYEDNKPIKVEYSAPRFSNPYYSCIAKDTYTVTYTIKDSYDSEIELTVKANGSLVRKETVSVDTKNVFEFSLPDNTNLKSIEILCTNSKGKSVSHTIKVSLADYAPSISGNGYFTMPNGEHIIDYYIYEKNDNNIELKVKVNNELINTETVQTNINNRVKFTMPESEEVKRIELICTNSRGLTDTYVYTQ